MDDIDYASPNTYICLKQTEGDKETEVYRWNIIKGKSSQTVEIPEGLTLPNGQYKLEVSVSNKQGNSAEPVITTEQYDNIYLYNYDADMTEAFGISKVTGSIHFAAEDPYQGADKVPYYGFAATGTYEFNRTSNRILPQPERMAIRQMFSILETVQHLRQRKGLLTTAAFSLR